MTGSYRGLFEQPTSTHPDRHLLVVSLRDLPEELKPAGTLLALDTLWRQVTDPQHRRRRLVVVDEAWWLAQQPAGARFLARLAKSARKHWCALTVVTQDAGDLLASELGQAVVANAATHVLLGQAPQAIDRLDKRLRADRGGTSAAAGRPGGGGAAGRVGWPAGRVLCPGLTRRAWAGHQRPGRAGRRILGGGAGVVTAADGPPPLPPLERFLGDPWGSLGELAGWLVGVAAGWGLRLLAVALPVGLVGVAAARGLAAVAPAAAGRRGAAGRHPGAAAGRAGRRRRAVEQPGRAAAASVAGWIRGPMSASSCSGPRQGLTVGLWVPGTVAPHLVERAVEAAWPGARASFTAATPPLSDEAGTRVLGGALRLAGGPWQPLRTEHWVDPLRALLGAAGELAGGETAVTQVLARPAAGRRLRRASRAARALAGAPSPRARVVGGLLDLLTPGRGRTPKRPAGAGEALRMAEARAALAKLAGPCWEVQVRYGVAGPDRPDRQGRLRARAHALAAAFAVHSGRNRLGRHRLRHPARTLATRPLHRGDLLSTGELASLAHLPADPAVPGLARAGARPVPPPPGLPTTGKLLGDSELGTPRPVRLTPADACQHVHLLGATGSGKSTLITNLALQDIEAGRGVVVVDPKGDLITDLLDRLPAGALGRLVLLDPDERAAPPTLNPLDGDDPDLAVDHLVGILHRIWIAHWGPRIDDVLRASCLTLLRRPGATLTDIPRLLGDPDFRRPYLAGAG